MSAVGKTVKFTLSLLGILLVLVICIGGYVYLNMNSLAKTLAEKAGSEALGVPVTIGGMDIQLENLKVVVSDIAVANPSGYKNKNVITVKSVTVDGESFSKDLLTFSLVQVDGTAVNLEAGEDGFNLGALKEGTQKTIEEDAASEESSSDSSSDIKVIVRKFVLTDAQLTPSVTPLGGTNLPTISVPDIRLSNIGEKENGVLAQDAVAQVMDAVLDKFNGVARGAGFLTGVSLDAFGDIGLSTGEAITEGLEDGLKDGADSLKEGLGGLKGIFD